LQFAILKIIEIIIKIVGTSVLVSQNVELTVNIVSETTLIHRVCTIGYQQLNTPPGTCR